VKKKAPREGEADSRRQSYKGETQPKHQTLNFKQNRTNQASTINQTSDRSDHFELELPRPRKIRSRRSFARPPRGGTSSRSHSRIDSFDGELAVGAANQKCRAGATLRHQHRDQHRLHSLQSLLRELTLHDGDQAIRVPAEPLFKFNELRSAQAAE
jgi:hypothetical protein